MSDAYRQLIARKLAMIAPTGLTAFPPFPDGLFPHQSALIAWALRRGRCAIFADTGLGKTRMQLVWAWIIHVVTGLDILILAPLAVAAQTVAEGELLDIHVTLCRDGADVCKGINITNYDRLHRFDPKRFGAVVLDESSCIKHHDSRMLQLLMDAFAHAQFKLCASATPAPNDWTELGTHAEFLGICKRVEMLAEFFVHDGGDTQTWRLKGHARELFWRWVSSWGAMVRSPADLGFDARAYQLPPLRVHEHIVESPQNATGMLFEMEAQTLSERRNARRSTINQRVSACVTLIKDSICGSPSTQTIDERNQSAIPSTDQNETRSPEIQRDAMNTCANGPRETGSMYAYTGSEQPNDAMPLGDIDTQTIRSKESASARKLIAGSSATQRSDSHSDCESSESQLRNTKGCSQIKAEAAQSAEPPKARTNPKDQRTVSADCMLTTATRAESSEDSYAAHAISASGSFQTASIDLFGRLNTCKNSDEQWLIWVDLNAEQDVIAGELGDECVSIYGSLDAEEKEARFELWKNGKVRCLVSKPSIFGFGVNMQFCRNMAFVGVTDSFEAYYQAIRRAWRFGQKRPVDVHIFASEAEGAVVANLRRKERDALTMAEALSAQTREAVRAQVTGTHRQSNPYDAHRRIQSPAWLRSEIA